MASSTLVGPPAALLARWSNTSPSIISESSIVPPCLHTTLTFFRSIIPDDLSAIFSRLSTAMGASRFEYCDTTLDDSDVVAAFRRLSRSSTLTGTANSSSRNLTAYWHALSNASEITVGCIPFSNSSSAFFNSDPQMTTTDVVPSPATTSCDLDSSTSIFAAGCCTCILFRIVAPSFVMITSPVLALDTILSIPRGPSDVRTASAIALADSMFRIRTSRLFESADIRMLSAEFCAIAAVVAAVVGAAIVMPV